jgi:hypothetical protein
MSDQEPPQTAGARRPYTAPTVIKVPLRPQEAVLGFCKTNTVAAGVGSPVDCTTCASPGS